MRPLRMLVVVGSAAAMGACLAAGEPCCTDDLGCAAGTRCFEGMCAARCDELSPCEEAFHCVAEVGVCALKERDASLDVCPRPEPRR